MKQLKRRVIVKTLIVAGISSLLFLAMHQGFFALGVLIGAFTGVGCFQLLARHIDQSAAYNLAKIKPHFFLKYLVRYVIMGIILFLCARVGLNLFLGAAAGLLLIYAVIFLEGLKYAQPRPDNY